MGTKVPQSGRTKTLVQPGGKTFTFMAQRTPGEPATVRDACDAKRNGGGKK
ncbi:hypothetical protein [Thermomonospora umbrina]|uniref:Uncharacterized protein n=1 Tax=Thermomonospora umbrina TaxID=111806 RepID=A0A3D9T1Y3_9ACTN|nr:hypothetical protein [Thermomonospora umbrina]REF00354.1 hypothetical protein DFJ69_5886 [Thermomonospora umbrina]